MVMRIYRVHVFSNGSGGLVVVTNRAQNDGEGSQEQLVYSENNGRNASIDFN